MSHYCLSRSGTFLLSLILFALFLVSDCKRFEPDGFLVVDTEEVEVLDEITYRLRGSISHMGAEQIDEHGFCWSLFEKPTTNNPKTDLGPRSNRGDFSSDISDLESNTLYNVRAYAISEAGTTYGKNIQFMTVSALPTVETRRIENIGPGWAEVVSNVTAEEGIEISKRGVCWNITGNPTLADDFTEDGSGSGTYTSVLGGLSCNTFYYVRAYAESAAGTIYGNQLEFTTGACELPEITTYSVNNVTSFSARSGGRIDSDGGSPVFVRGVCWNTTGDPTVADNFTEDGEGLGEFFSLIDGLQGSTPYFVRAYATNEAGTAYGDTETFNSGPSDNPGEKVAFAGTWFFPWPDEPFYEGVLGYHENPYNRSFHYARKASAGWSYEGIVDEVSFDASWDTMRYWQPCNKLVSNGVAGDPYDLENENPSFGLSWKGIHDGNKFYVFIKFLDTNQLLDPGVYFEIMDQPTSNFRHEPSFRAAQDSLAEHRMIYQNMAYGRFIELGGGLSRFDAEGTGPYFASAGLLHDKRDGQPYYSGSWESNNKGFDALQAENHFWHDDGSGTIRAIYVMPFDGVLSYPVDPANMEGDWETIKIGETFSFDIKMIGYIGGEHQDNEISYHWSADVNRSWASNYYSGYVLTTNSLEWMPDN